MGTSTEQGQGRERETTWAERLKKRQEELSGTPSSGCLAKAAPWEWPRKYYRNKLVVAAMCLAANGDCDACIKLLRRA